MSEQNTTLQISSPELEIDTQNPWKDDRLDRKFFADHLTQIISRQVNPCVITINGEWGSGKTFLLKRWQCELSKRQYVSLYFNAWDADSIEQAQLALIGELYGFLKDCDKSAFGELINELQESCSKLFSLSSLTKIISHKIEDGAGMATGGGGKLWMYIDIWVVGQRFLINGGVITGIWVCRLKAYQKVFGLTRIIELIVYIHMELVAHTGDGKHLFANADVSFSDGDKVVAIGIIDTVVCHHTEREQQEQGEKQTFHGGDGYCWFSSLFWFNCKVVLAFSEVTTGLPVLASNSARAFRAISPP